MKNLKKENWYVLKRRLENMALAASGRTIRLEWLPDSSYDVGYTQSGNKIFISNSHRVYDGLDNDEKVMCVMGVFAHELMHQLNTDFKASDRAKNALPANERQIFQIIMNILEDPAIENHAHRYFGGLLLKALHFSVQYFYRLSPEINRESSPFGQWMSAMIQYGDGGYVKGSIADPDAAEIFAQTLPLADCLIDEPDGKKRIKLGKEVFELTRPLWQKDADSGKMMEELARQLEQSGKSARQSEGDGPGPDGTPEESGTDLLMESKKGRRKAAAKAASEHADKASKDKPDGKPGGEVEEPVDKTGFSTVSRSGKDSGAAKENAESGSDKGNKDLNGNTDSVIKADDSDKSEAGCSEDAGNNPDGNSGSEIDGVRSEIYDSGSEAEAVKESMDFDSITLTAEDIDALSEAVEGAFKESESMSERSSGGIIDVPGLDKKYIGVRCVNIDVGLGDGSKSMARTYSALVKQMSGGINLLTSQLKRIFKNAQAEKTYKCSGRLSVKRYSEGRASARTFTRRKEPDIGDICVELVVDISGSMRGERITNARNTAIALSETFAQLGVPYKVIAFTADNYVNGRTYEAIHYHYVNWKDSDNARLSLANLTAQCNNFDGYSIRYAASVIDKRPEAHKLMIVISDGQPACRYYRNSEDGISDTRNAIREAKKYAKVIGVAIGADREILFRMYGRGFVNIKNVNELFPQLGTVIAKEVRSWA